MNNLFYIESQLLCIVLGVILLKFNSEALKNNIKYVYMMCVLTVFASVMDICRIASYGKLLPVQIFCSLFCLSLIFTGYLWTLYCADSFGLKNKKLRLILALPAIVISLAVLISAKYGLAYSAGENGILFNGSFYYIPLFSCIYPFISFGMAVYAARKLNKKRQGQRFILISTFSIPAVLSVIQMVFLPNALCTVTYAVLFTALIAFTDYNNQRMVVDNLTGLPNRFGMHNEIKVQLRQFKRDKNDSFYVIVCDMDNFKTINDTWGHSEGDRALKLIAESLDTVAEQYDSKIFRIGGDEFVIITNTSEKDLADKVCASVEAALDGIDFRDDFDISMSMGVAVYAGGLAIDELIDSADKKLYQAKKNNKE